MSPECFHHGKPGGSSRRARNRAGRTIPFSETQTIDDLQKKVAGDHSRLSPRLLLRPLEIVAIVASFAEIVSSFALATTRDCRHCRLVCSCCQPNAIDGTLQHRSPIYATLVYIFVQIPVGTGIVVQHRTMSPIPDSATV